MLRNIRKEVSFSHRFNEDHTAESISNDSSKQQTSLQLLTKYLDEERERRISLREKYNLTTTRDSLLDTDTPTLMSKIKQQQQQQRNGRWGNTYGRGNDNEDGHALGDSSDHHRSANSILSTSEDTNVRESKREKRRRKKRAKYLKAQAKSVLRRSQNTGSDLMLHL